MLFGPKQRIDSGRIPEHFEWSNIYKRKFLTMHRLAIERVSHMQTWLQREDRHPLQCTHYTHTMRWKLSCTFTWQLYQCIRDTSRKILKTLQVKEKPPYMLDEVQQWANTAARLATGSGNWSNIYSRKFDRMNHKRLVAWRRRDIARMNANIAVCQPAEITNNTMTCCGSWIDVRDVGSTQEQIYFTAEAQCYRLSFYRFDYAVFDCHVATFTHHSIYCMCICSFRCYFTLALAIQSVYVFHAHKANGTLNWVVLRHRERDRARERAREKERKRQQ